MGTAAIPPMEVDNAPRGAAGDRLAWRAKRRSSHSEVHRSGRAGWLRAAVLGSDDAIVSTASLMLGVAASSAHCRARRK
jgi:VIT1/CCC1 family predicted Fe2+/Mn2+ transporter